MSAARPWRRALALTALAALTLLGALPRLLSSQTSVSLPPVGLEDQFGRRHALAALLGQPLVLLIADRGGADASTRWMAALQRAGGGQRVLVVADLTGAPRLLHGFIRSRMPRDTLVPILLDWNGALAPALRGATDHLVAAVFDRAGVLRRRAALPLDRVDDALLVALVRDANASRETGAARGNLGGNLGSSGRTAAP